MTTLNQTEYTKDIANRKLHAKRMFDAPLEIVWKAWTTAELLDQWWAPRPWQTKTKTMNFEVGGRWLYAMMGPSGECHWCKVDFVQIVPQKSFTTDNSFCDEHGVTPEGVFSGSWDVRFTPVGEETLVEVTLTFQSDAHMDQFISLGFEAGFAMGHTNLDELLLKLKK